MHLLDGATGTELWKAGMPRNVCPEQWILEHPQPLLALQQAYASAGSEIIYAPTFRAQPMALSKWNLAEKAESINRELVALSRKAAPGCLVAGDMTTMHGCIDPGQEDRPRQMKAAYLRQMEALIAAGADLLAAETLMDSFRSPAEMRIISGPGKQLRRRLKPWKKPERQPSVSIASRLRMNCRTSSRKFAPEPPCR